jgi:hypothetical protein
MWDEAARIAGDAIGIFAHADAGRVMTDQP